MEQKFDTGPPRRSDGRDKRQAKGQRQDGQHKQEDNDGQHRRQGHRQRKQRGQRNDKRPAGAAPAGLPAVFTADSARILEASTRGVPKCSVSFSALSRPLSWANSDKI